LDPKPTYNVTKESKKIKKLEANFLGNKMLFTLKRQDFPKIK
jgi:hypothetical protein